MFHKPEINREKKKKKIIPLILTAFLLSNPLNYKSHILKTYQTHHFTSMTAPANLIKHYFFYTSLTKKTGYRTTCKNMKKPLNYAP